MKIRTFLAEHFFDLRVISRIQCFKMSRQLNVSLSSKATSLLRQSDAQCPLNQDFLFPLTLIGTRHEFTVNILKGGTESGEKSSGSTSWQSVKNEFACAFI